MSITSVTRALRTHGNLPAGDAATIDTALAEIINVALADNADVGSGGTTGSVSFQLKDFAGKDLAVKTIIGFGAFDPASADATKPGVVAANATLATAAKGDILDGSGTATLMVQTDATGLFTCTLTDATDEVVFLVCRPIAGSPIVDCRSLDTVEFTA